MLFIMSVAMHVYSLSWNKNICVKKDDSERVCFPTVMLAAFKNISLSLFLSLTHTHCAVVMRCTSPSRDLIQSGGTPILNILKVKQRKPLL